MPVSETVRVENSVFFKVSGNPLKNFAAFGGEFLKKILKKSPLRGEIP